MSNIDLYFDWNGDRVRISSARLRTQADADELIGAITIVRRLLPGDAASETARPVAPAGEAVAPSSPAIHSAAPAASPALPTGPQAKHAAEEPSVCDGSGEVRDESAIHLATHSEAGKTPKAPAFHAPLGERNERTVRREEVAALNSAEPWLTPDEAAARLQIPVVNLRIFSTEIEVTWSHPRPSLAAPASAVAPAPQRTLRDRVTDMHRMHPSWTARMIANELGALVASVSSYLAGARRSVGAEREKAA